MVASKVTTCVARLVTRMACMPSNTSNWSAQYLSGEPHLCGWAKSPESLFLLRAIQPGAANPLDCFGIPAKEAISCPYWERTCSSRRAEAQHQLQNNWSTQCAHNNEKAKKLNHKLQKKTFQLFGKGFEFFSDCFIM